MSSSLARRSFAAFSSRLAGLGLGLGRCHYSQSKHRLVASAVLQRWPVITEEPNSFEKAYAAYKKALDTENARTFVPELFFKRTSTGKGGIRLETALDMEGAGFKPASRTTAADEKGDIRSLDRKLDRTLYLVVKKPRSWHAWQFPQGGFEDSDDGLHETARRELLEECGNDMEVWFAGRAPCAHYIYKFPPQVDVGFEGAKVFFFIATLLNKGSVTLDKKELEDYAWLDKEELKGVFSPQYYEAVKNILVH